MLMDLNNPLAFCKLIQSGEVFISKVQVPSCFIKENKKILSKACLLKTDEVGMSWEVKIVREKSNNYFLCEGEWPQFVVHHQLKQGDVLLFFLVEKSTFRVQPYTQKCCGNIGEKKLFYEELSSSSSEEEIGPSLRKSKSARKVDSTEEESVDTSSNDEDDPPYSHRATYFKNPKLEKASSDDEEKDGLKKFRGCGTTSVMNFRSDHPYYEMVVKRSHTTFMTIPKRFAKKTGIISMKKMRLVNEERKEYWRVAIGVHSCGTIHITRGWAAFRTHNKIAYGDSCRFKLIQENILQVQKVPKHPSLQCYH